MTEADIERLVWLVPDALVEVEWHDSEHVNLGWAERADYIAALHDRTPYRTVGYVVEATDDHVMLVMSRSDAGIVGTGMVIPTGMLRGVRALT